MNKKQIIHKVLSGCLLSLALLCGACGSTKNAVKANKKGALTAEVQLSSEEERKFEYFFMEANRYKLKGEYDTAYEMYNHCLDINPQSASVLYEMAHFSLFLNQPGKAQAQLEKAVELDPENIWYKQTLAAYYQQKGETEKAIAVYEDIATQFPKRSEALMVLVDLYGREKRYEDVIHTLNRLEVKEGKSEQISMEKFRMYLTMNNQEKAFSEIESLVKEYPNDFRYKVILGDVYLNNNKFEEARGAFQSVLDEEPDNALAQLSMASYYEKMNLDSLYRNQLDTVLLNKKLDTETKLNMMRRLIIDSEQKKQDSTKVLTLFHHMMAEEDETADISMLCAQYMISKNMDEEAVKPVLNHILSIEPDNTAARLQLLSYAVKKNDYEQAIAICKPALEYNPDVIEFYYYLGLSYYQAEKKEEALETFLKGLDQINAGSDKGVISQFYELVGDLYHQKKMSEKSYAAYDSALVYNPDNISALNNYAYYLSLEKVHLDKAEEMSYRTVKAEPQNGTYLDTYAWILFEKGRYAEAKIYMDDAIKNGAGDDSSVVLEHCGDIYYMNGETEKALEYWKQAAGMEHESKTLERKIKLKKYIAE